MSIPAESPNVVVKTGRAGALSREAAALRRVATLDVAPSLVSWDGRHLRSERLDGQPRTLSTAARADLRALGALVRRVHDSRHHASGGLPSWSSPARTLRGYRRRRAADAVALAGRRHRALAERVVASLPALPPVDAVRPFRMLHGDLVEGNIVWTPRGPRLVDWEFWRIGDPAEDLAYLAELNTLGPPAIRAVLAGYGAPGMASRLESWRPLVALDAGAWYAREGIGPDARRFLGRAGALAALF